MNRVGHAFIKQRMREEDGIFAGEVTGHYYFRDFYYADNGFIPALLILELMSKKNKSLRELLAPFRERYFISGEINTKLRSMDEVPGQARGHRGALQGRDDRDDGRRVGGLSRLALQRPAVEHRAAAAAESRSGHAGDMERRRDEVLRSDPRLGSGPRHREPRLRRKRINRRKRSNGARTRSDTGTPVGWRA